MLRFHAIGKWQASQIYGRQVPSTRRSIAQVEKIIESEWHRALARPDVRLFDGPMCRLESFVASDRSLHLDLSTTSYKPFLGTNLLHPELADEYGSDVMANPVGVSSLIQSADDQLLLGQRNSAVAYYPNRTHPFAGALEPRDAGDVIAAVRREMQEELSLGREDICEIMCIGIAEDRALRQPELIFHVRTIKSAAQLQSQVLADEHGGSVAIAASSAAARGAMRDPALTPIAVASLLLWGRVTFGDAWFESLRQGVEAR